MATDVYFVMKKNNFIWPVINGNTAYLNEIIQNREKQAKLNNPWHHLRKMSSWVGNPGRPPYVIPRGSAGLKKNIDLALYWKYITVKTCSVYRIEFMPNYVLNFIIFINSYVNFL